MSRFFVFVILGHWVPGWHKWRLPGSPAKWNSARDIPEQPKKPHWVVLGPTGVQNKFFFVILGHWAPGWHKWGLSGSPANWNSAGDIPERPKKPYWVVLGATGVQNKFLFCHSRPLGAWLAQVAASRETGIVQGTYQNDRKKTY